MAGGKQFVDCREVVHSSECGFLFFENSMHTLCIESHLRSPKCYTQ